MPGYLRLLVSLYVVNISIWQHRGLALRPEADGAPKYKIVSYTATVATDRGWRVPPSGSTGDVACQVEHRDWAIATRAHDSQSFGGRFQTDPLVYAVDAVKVTDALDMYAEFTRIVNGLSDTAALSDARDLLDPNRSAFFGCEDTRMRQIDVAEMGWPIGPMNAL